MKAINRFAQPGKRAGPEDNFLGITCIVKLIHTVNEVQLRRCRAWLSRRGFLKVIKSYMTALCLSIRVTLLCRAFSKFIFMRLVLPSAAPLGMVL